MRACTKRHAMGITLHTGWGACVVVGGSLHAPEIVANEIIDLVGDEERFCFHRAADMDHASAEKWIARVKDKAFENARRALSSLMAKQVSVCAIVAKEGAAGDLREVLASHPRIHSAEGYFYRDIVRSACTVPVRVVPPSTLDASAVGKLAPAPWGRDQKLAALAAWSVMGDRSSG
jgi:hypothetical protein